MEYVTHLREDGSYQLLKEHLEGTATRSAKFAASFGSSSHAERTALLHDIDKYSPNGQRRQRDPEHTAKLDHSTAGAKAAADLDDMHAAFAIAGHHGGLPDLGTRLSLDDGTLCARLNKKLTGSDDPSAWRSEISLPTGVQLTPPWLPRNDVRLTAMYIRMLFSCLVDADFLDTERAEVGLGLFQPFGNVRLQLFQQRGHGIADAARHFFFVAVSYTHLTLPTILLV